MNTVTSLTRTELNRPRWAEGVAIRVRKIGVARVLLAIAVLFIAAHICLAFAPFVNLESWYANAAVLLLHGRFRDGLLLFEKAIANPLGSVLGIVPFYAVFGVSEASARLYSILCGSFVILLYSKLRTLAGLGPAATVAASLTTALNPFFWVYSGSAYSDVPFILLISLGIFGAWRATRNSTPLGHLGAACLLGLAALTKYNILVFIPLVLLIVITESFYRYRNRSGGNRYILGSLAVYATVAAIIVGPYLAWMRNVAGHLLKPEWVNGMSLDPRAVTPAIFGWRLVAHVIWIGIFMAPFAIIPFASLIKSLGSRRAFAAIAVLTVVAAFSGPGVVDAQNTISNFGEMQVGWLAWLIPFPRALRLMYALLCLIGAVTLAAFIPWVLARLRERYLLGAWLVFVVSLHSAIRPTNRYVLFLLPPLSLWLGQAVRDEIQTQRFRVVRHLAVGLGVMLSAGLCAFNSVYFAREGIAAAEIARFVNLQRLDGVEAGINNSVWCHSGYLVDPRRFRTPNDELRYRVVTLGRSEQAPGILFERPVTILGLTFKRYAIVTASGAPPRQGASWHSQPRI